MSIHNQPGSSDLHCPFRRRQRGSPGDNGNLWVGEMLTFGSSEEYLAQDQGLCASTCSTINSLIIVTNHGNINRTSTYPRKHSHTISICVCRSLDNSVSDPGSPSGHLDILRRSMRPHSAGAGVGMGIGL